MSFPSAEQVGQSLRRSPVRHLIDGRLCTSTKAFEVFNPATGEAIAACPEADLAQLDAAVAAAQAAQPAWAATPVGERRARVARMGELLREHAAELAALVTLEQGKPLARALDEVLRSASHKDLKPSWRNRVARVGSKRSTTWTCAQRQPCGSEGNVNSVSLATCST